MKNTLRPTTPLEHALVALEIHDQSGSGGWVEMDERAKATYSHIYPMLAGRLSMLDSRGYYYDDMEGGFYHKDTVVVQSGRDIIVCWGEHRSEMSVTNNIPMAMALVQHHTGLHESNISRKQHRKLLESTVPMRNKQARESSTDLSRLCNTASKVLAEGRKVPKVFTSLVETPYDTNSRKFNKNNDLAGNVGMGIGGSWGYQNALGNSATARGLSTAVGALAGNAIGRFGHAAGALAGNAIGRFGHAAGHLANKSYKSYKANKAATKTEEVDAPDKDVINRASDILSTGDKKVNTKQKSRTLDGKFAHKHQIDDVDEGRIANAATGSLGGAAAGGMLGSYIGGIGAIPGAIAGGALGAVTGGPSKESNEEDDLEESMPVTAGAGAAAGYALGRKYLGARGGAIGAGIGALAGLGATVVGRGAKRGYQAVAHEETADPSPETIEDEDDVEEVSAGDIGRFGVNAAKMKFDAAAGTPGAADATIATARHYGTIARDNAVRYHMGGQHTKLNLQNSYDVYYVGDGWGKKRTLNEDEAPAPDSWAKASGKEMSSEFVGSVGTTLGNALATGAIAGGEALYRMGKKKYAEYKKNKEHELARKKAQAGHRRFEDDDDDKEPVSGKHPDSIKRDSDGKFAAEAYDRVSEDWKTGAIKFANLSGKTVALGALGTLGAYGMEKGIKALERRARWAPAAQSQNTQAAPAAPAAPKQFAGRAGQRQRTSNGRFA